MIGRQKITVNLPEGSWKALGERAERDGITRSEALRRSIWLFTYVRGRQEAGDELLLESEGGDVQHRIVLEVTEPEPGAAANRTTQGGFQHG